MPAKAKRAMPKWTKAPEALVATFDLALAPFPKAERRKMFGYPAAFANGNMFAGLFQDRMMMRLPEDERAKFLKLKGARLFEPMPGRPMREYVEVPEAVMNSKAKLKNWLGKSYEYAQSLPAKAKKKAK
jgi:TfoX/Sxy family transcriptional regulator of competence genes